MKNILRIYKFKYKNLINDCLPFMSLSKDVQIHISKVRNHIKSACDVSFLFLSSFLNSGLKVIHIVSIRISIFSILYFTNYIELKDVKVKFITKNQVSLDRILIEKIQKLKKKCLNDINDEEINGKLPYLTSLIRFSVSKFFGEIYVF